MPERKSSLILALARVFFDQASTWRLLLFTILGYAFSLAVILCTLGLMDGFSSTLKEGLRLSSGDAILTNQNGFFKINNATLEEMQLHGVKAIASVVQTEAFILHDGKSQGVLVKGIENEEMSQVTGMDFQISEGEIIVGETLAKDWRIKNGDYVSLVLASGKEGDLPQFMPLTVKHTISHGIHEKDSRLVYVELAQLRAILGIDKKMNVALLSFGTTQVKVAEVQERVDNLREVLGRPWILRPAWQEFAGLLEAVEIEKTSIAIVLQVIVLVAIFNVAAFLITLQTRKTREFFLLNALGMPRKRFFTFASSVLFTLWILSCAFAYLFVKFFNYLLLNASWLQVPGDVYVLTKLQVLLQFSDYLFVFGCALLWMVILGGLALKKMQRTSLLSGLRQEFQ